MPCDDDERVRRLLALKRHEQPPTGYFGGLSDEVMARLKAPSAAPPATPLSWRQWLFEFDFKPILVGAYGMGVCGLLLLGIGAAIPLRDQPLEAQLDHYPLGGAVLVAMPEQAMTAAPLALPHPLEGGSSLNPVVNGEPPDYLFNSIGSLKTQPAAFRSDGWIP